MEPVTVYACPDMSLKWHCFGVADEKHTPLLRSPDDQRVFYLGLGKSSETMGDRITNSRLIPGLGGNVDQPGEGLNEFWHVEKVTADHYSA